MVIGSQSVAIVRYLSGAFLLVSGYSYYLNRQKRSHEYMVVPSRDFIETQEERHTRRHLELMAQADASFKHTDMRVAPTSEEPFEADPKIRDCMKQYQVDHPQGYRLFDAVENCDCQLPKGVSVDKLKGIFVRSQDRVSDSLTQVELRMMGVKTNPDALLPYAEAKRLRKVGLAPGVDPNKPRNTLLEGAYAVTPRDGAWEELGMINYWDSVKWKTGTLKYGSLWNRDTWGG